ncbi:MULTISPECIES: Rv0909 family putative TA system antitoxin [Barrientosiimonas]|uniref:Antitoxin n=1 Tax=Barrientosiimonas endolithica TaxID=1535208 RepID=A0ABM8HDA6_9MICO|nr:Rv0909 family putative TA system antitoxin [Barrientosiimonas endolithica]BDZ58961.1 hypothetical protein GCM10025872_26180 [Barrientosiimonas endolithica]
MAIANLFNKLRGYAQKNPDKARQAIEKIEGVVDQKTGGKYRSQVDKASSTAADKLGIPRDQNRQPGQVPTPEGQAPGGQTPGQTPGGQVPPQTPPQQ